ncbi:hypothetical protein [Pseudomonas corrugata]|uniref:hypothetical protein n=1 Tax=Pseudomonas corrugata TaxID=47879 RepID=UPI000463A933|nr:hypothetical protein [Pseudomonas corrugata]
MSYLPIPFFETHSRFSKLALDTLDKEQSEVRNFLIGHDDAAITVKSYKVVHLFLSGLSASTYQAYRTHIEKLLSWVICIARKDITHLDMNDVHEFLEFCNDPPCHWIGSVTEKRFIRTNGGKRNSDATYVINRDWRPFVSAIEVSTDEDNGLFETKVHQYAKASTTMLVSVCRSFFLFLQAEDLMTANPMREVDVSGLYAHSQTDYPQQSVFSSVEWRYIVKAMNSLIAHDRSHERTLFIVMSIYHLYLKSGDFSRYSRALRMSDFFPDDQGSTWLALGNAGDYQNIRVPEEYLSIHLQRYRRYLGVDSIPLALDSAPLFATHAGRPGLATRYVNGLFQTVLMEAVSAMQADGHTENELQNLRAGSIKWLRHTSANLSAEQRSVLDLNADLRIVNIQATEDRYYKGKMKNDDVHSNR